MSLQHLVHAWFTSLQDQRHMPILLPEGHDSNAVHVIKGKLVMMGFVLCLSSARTMFRCVHRWKYRSSGSVSKYRLCRTIKRLRSIDYGRTSGCVRSDRRHQPVGYYFNVTNLAPPIAAADICSGASVDTLFIRAG